MLKIRPLVSKHVKIRMLRYICSSPYITSCSKQLDDTLTQLFFTLYWCWCTPYFLDGKLVWIHIIEYPGSFEEHNTSSLNLPLYF